jgi:NAD(P)-dependent dehydrogenase (short-subunit alcohol dehydrogenase family)
LPLESTLGEALGGYFLRHQSRNWTIAGVVPSGIGLSTGRDQALNETRLNYLVALLFPRASQEAGHACSRPAPDTEAPDDDLELKLFAAVRLIRLVAPQMRERRWGRIINVLNIGAKAPRPNSMPTSISRGVGMA